MFPVFKLQEKGMKVKIKYTNQNKKFPKKKAENSSKESQKQ
jgi:hypothetical protein